LSPLRRLPRGAGARAIPWERLWLLGRWLYTQGRRRLEENLTASERRELGRLLSASRGRRGRLTSGEQARLRELTRKVFMG
jgi:hypothetical protein